LAEEYLPTRPKTLGSSPSTTKEKKKGEENLIKMF
jgi:hypothetical protein